MTKAMRIGWLFLAGCFLAIAFSFLNSDPEAAVKPLTERNDLFAVKVDSAAKRVTCRTVPFLASPSGRRGETTRRLEGSEEVIPVGAAAEAVYLLGMFNQGWDHGLAHWGEHKEFSTDRSDRILIGDEIGYLEIRYAGGTSDRIPLTMGATVWSVEHWAYGPSNSVMKAVKEPFASRPDYAELLARCLKLYEDDGDAANVKPYKQFYLAIKPRALTIDSIIIRDNPAIRGRPLISAITLASPQPTEHLEHLDTSMVDEADMQPKLNAADSMDWSADLRALAHALYTYPDDLPGEVSLEELPAGLDAARIRFLGEKPWANMLSNIWTANLIQMDAKFIPATGFFGETGKDTPWYGGYQGIGTWAPDIGVYSAWAYGRSSDHFATLILRCVHNPERSTNFVDYVDKFLYFYRANHDPDKGPPNRSFDISKYPADAPPHWGFVMNEPGSFPQSPINELPGDEEMDGHGATAIGRYVAWRTMGCPKDEWLTAARKDVYGKSRWDSTRDAAEFICWLMDYTGRDVIWSEGESTGWGGGRVPANMPEPTDPESRKKKYAQADMYEVYPAHMCMVALRCSAAMADAVGQADSARRWRSYAARIESAMLKELTTTWDGLTIWRCTPSVFPSMQEALAPAWAAIYLDGYDPQRWQPQMAEITRNYLRRQLTTGPRSAAVLAMGYGQGWLTHAALMLDEMDGAGQCLVNLAKCTYDKNMNYVDAERGIDWRKWLWIIPEGVHALPDGGWYRVGDLSNGANQGPAIHAIEACAGIDDTDPSLIRILPRVPDPLSGIEVNNFPALVDGGAPRIARISYAYSKNGSFTFHSDLPVPNLAVRLGPFDSRERADQALKKGTFPPGSTQSIERSGRLNGKDAYWLWVHGVDRVSELSIAFGTTPKP